MAYIDILPDELLARVFGYLSPLELLEASEVCRKWISVVQLLWLAIKRLDVSELPPLSIGAVLGLCPKLERIIAHDHKVNLDDVSDHLRDTSLRAIHFYNVQLAVGPNGVKARALPGAFKDSITCFVGNVSQLESFVWHNVCPTNFRYRPINLPRHTGFFFQVGAHLSALTRLQLTGGPEIDASHLFTSLRQLTNLECLALGGDLRFNAKTDPHRTFKFAVAPLAKLRELVVVNLVVLGGQESVVRTLLRDTMSLLPSLEVLVVVKEPRCFPRFIWSLGAFVDLAQWIEAHPLLKLLLIAANGHFTPSDVVIPPRLVPNGNGFRCLPPLNIFVGGLVVQCLRFRQSAAAKIWPISERMPQFLERPDVAEAFEGTWAAEMILEAEKYSVETWQYDEFLSQAIVYLP